MSDGAWLRAVAFGDAEGRVWGAAIAAAATGSQTTAPPADAAGGRALIAFGLREGRGQAASVALAPDGRGWRLTADGIALEVQPAGEEGPAHDGDGDGGGEPTGFQELCRVTGELTLSGDTHRVDCVGTRCALDGLQQGSLGSLRAVSGWFGSDDAFMLLALRKDGQRGQEADLVAATLFDPEGWAPVADPRLSTTYDVAGTPQRTNLELWIGEGDNEFPRRAAGESAGEAATIESGGCSVRVVPLHCHSRGRDGAGVYVLAAL